MITVNIFMIIALVSSILILLGLSGVSFIRNKSQELFFSLTFSFSIFGLWTYRAVSNCSGYCYFVSFGVILIGIVSLLIFGISYFILRKVKSQRINKIIKKGMGATSIIILLIGLLFILGSIGLGQLTPYNTELASSQNNLKYCYEGYDNNLLTKIISEVFSPRHHNPWTIDSSCVTAFYLQKAIEAKDITLCGSYSFCKGRYLTYQAKENNDANYCTMIESTIAQRSVCYTSLGLDPIENQFEKERIKKLREKTPREITAPISEK